MLIESGSYWLYYQENVYKLMFDLDIEKLKLRREVWTHELLEVVKNCLESNDTTSRAVTTKYLKIFSKTEYLTRQNKILALHQLKNLYRFPVLCPVVFIFTVTPRNVEDTTDYNEMDASSSELPPEYGDGQQQLQQHSLLSNLSRCEDVVLRRSRSFGSLNSIQQSDAKLLTGLEDNPDNKLLSSITNKTPPKCVAPETIATSTCNTSSPAECHNTQEQCIASTPSRSVSIRRRKFDASCSAEDDSPPRKKPLIQSDQPSEDVSERSCKHSPISTDGHILIKCLCGKNHCLKKQCSPQEDKADSKSTIQASLNDQAHNSPIKKADNDILRDRTNHLKNFVGECTEKYHLCKNHQIVAVFGVVCTEDYCKAHEDDVNIKFGMVPGHNNKKHDISDLLIDACNGEVDLSLMCEAKRCCSGGKCTVEPCTASDGSHDATNVGSCVNTTAHDSEVCSALHTDENVAASVMKDFALEKSISAPTVPAMESEERYSQADNVTFLKNVDDMPISEKCRKGVEETSELAKLCCSDTVIETQILPNKNYTSLSSSSGSYAPISSSSTSVAASSSTYVPVSLSTNVPMTSGTSVSEIVGPSPARAELSTETRDNRQVTCNKSDQVVYPRPLDYSQVLTRRQFETHVGSCEGKRYLDVADILSSSQNTSSPDLRTRSMKGTSVNVIKLLQDMMNYPTVVLQRIDEVLNLSINPPSRKR